MTGIKLQDMVGWSITGQQVLLRTDGGHGWSWVHAVVEGTVNFHKNWDAWILANIFTPVFNQDISKPTYVF